jgi:putative transposase
MTRQAWISQGAAVSVVQQCVLAGVSRATVYAQQKALLSSVEGPKAVDESDLLFGRLIDEEYTRHPFYGSAPR